ncbi:hypothetical protein BASA81_016031 [Batrachochytrium salamandrivorans]|nr:hypothetical protein BASA81_016031 [Batrachochytrium salamandrivorans]
MSISIACSLAVPTFIQQVIYFLIPQYPRALLLIQSGPGLAFVLFALQLSASIFGRTCDQIIHRIQINIRTIIICAIYEKVLRLSGKSSVEFTQGKILNLVNVDSEKIANAIQSINGLYATPIQIVVAVYLLGQLLGVSFRALEEFFSDRITRIRNDQIESLKNILFQPLLVLPGSLTGVILAGVSWVRIRDFLLAEEAESFSIINAETTPGAPKDVAIQLTDATFRWEVQKTEAKKANSKMPKQPKRRRNPRRWMKKSSATDTPSSATIAQQETDMKDESVLFHLRNITTLIKKGSLVVVVGPVGSGKSSFLSGIIGEMRCRSGALDIYGSLGYCSQQAWILTETIQGNIMFNSPLNQTRLDAVIKASCLSNDLHQFPSGRMTQIGEKGVNLSGGQKARVSLARAMYQDCDTYLLDDPISALDAHVGAEVFDLSIKKMLKGKTVVLVTHQLHFLPEADHVIVMGNGTIAEQGTFTELMANKSGHTTVTDIWLTWWTENRFPNLTTMQYLQIYSGLGGSQVVFSLILNTSILVGGYHSAHYYHAAALKRLMAAPMSFYDSQPIGRILNRMSKDVESIDQAIWILLFLTIISSTGLLSIAILMAYVVPYMLLLIVPLIILYAFRVEDRFVKRQRELMNLSNTPSMLKVLGSVWVNLRIEILASTVILVLVLIGTTSDINSSQIGIALTYAIALTA